MPVLKDQRREAFARILATEPSLTDAQAHKKAGFGGDRANASRLRNSPEIVKRVAEIAESLTRKAEKQVEVTRAWVLKQLMDNAERCLTAGDERNPTAANRALELLGKEIGMFVDRRMIGVRRIEDMSEEELLEFLGGEPEPTELSAATSTSQVGHA